MQFCVCDTQGTILKYNQQAIKLWQASPKDKDTESSFYAGYRFYAVSGKPFAKGLTPLQIQGPNRRGKDVEVIMERPDGSLVYMKLNVIPLRNEKEKEVGAIVCFYDISLPEKTEKVAGFNNKLPASSFKKIIAEKTTDLRSTDSNPCISDAALEYSSRSLINLSILLAALMERLRYSASFSFKFPDKVSNKWLL